MCTWLQYVIINSIVYVCTGKLPLRINIQSGLSVGNHSVVIIARDSLGLTTATPVNYALQEEDETERNRTILL